MPYDIRFTDSSKTAITVADSSVDNTTNLQFQGKQVVNFSSIVGENFLHLLENFASATPPSDNLNGSPIAGQLWYNTTIGATQLMVYDGAIWTPAGGLYKGVSSPSIANVGDLWVNTATQQLHLYTGSGWILVGPNYSVGQRTGPEPETIVDTSNVSQSVISNYVNGIRVAIISSSTFTPKAQIVGFPTINAGITLSTSYNTFWGTAQKANALVIGNLAVDASNFLRGDTASVTNFPLSVKNNSGVSIGGDNHFSLSTNGSDSYVYNKMSGGNILVQVTNLGNRTTVITVDSRSRVGIKNSNPQYDVDVTGAVHTTGDITTDANLGATGNVTAGGNLTVTGASTFTGALAVGGNIIPSGSGTISVGSVGSPLQSVHANTFYGNFNGNLTGTFTGNISGSASKLASPTTFAFDQAGDVVSAPITFDGQTGGLTKTFNAIISDSLIHNKVEVTSTVSTDEVMISRDSSLKKISTQNFFSAIPTFPVGCIMPYAGSAAPAGWLLCDGSEISASLYTNLFNVVNYTYGSQGTLVGTNTFKLPDLRGRFPMGLDNMDNNGPVPLVPSPANRVTETGSTVLGGYGGSETKTLVKENIPDHRHDMKGDSNTQFYGVTHTLTGTDADAATDVAFANDIQNTAKYLPHSGDMVGATTQTTPMGVMNPWLGLNYIIYTGVL